MRRLQSSKTLVALPLWLAAIAFAGPLHGGDPPAPPTSPAPPGANAQVSATAEALFEQGRLLMKDKKYGEACPKLAESLRIDPATGTMLYLADCYEKNGQTASAWATFNDAVGAAQNAGQGERALKAKLRVQALVPKLVKLTITLSPQNVGVEGLVLERDGLAIGAALFGTPIPVDPGDHNLEVVAPGKKPWSGVVNVPSKAGTVIAFVVPALEDVPALPPPEPPPAPTATATAAPLPTVTATVVVPPPLPTAPPPDDSSMRNAGLAVGGIGLAGIAIGSALGLTAKSRNDEAIEKYCPGGQFCSDPMGITLTNDAKSLALGSTIAFVIGGAAVAAGAVLLIYPIASRPAPGKTSSGPTSPAVNLVVRPGSLGLTGRF